MRNNNKEGNNEPLIFFSHSAKLFKFFGLWGDDKNLREVKTTTICPTIILICAFLMLIMVGGGYLEAKSQKKYAKSLLLLICWFAFLVAGIKTFTIWKSMHRLKKCFGTLQHIADKFENQTYILGALKLYRVLFTLGLVFLNITSFFYFIMPIFESTRTLPLDIKNPVEIIDLMQSPFYEIIYAYQVIEGVILANCLISLDTMFCGVMTMVKAILESINDVFEEAFITKTKGTLSEKEKLKIFGGIIEIFPEICEIIDIIKSIFNLVSITHFMLNIGVIGIALYFLSVLKFENIITIAMTVNIFFQTFLLGLYCYFGEAVVHQTQILRQNLYNCDWYNQSESFKFMILISLQRLQKEPFIAAGKVVPLSLATFADVMKKAYTAYAFLHNVKNK